MAHASRTDLRSVGDKTSSQCRQRTESLADDKRGGAQRGAPTLDQATDGRLAASVASAVVRRRRIISPTAVVRVRGMTVVAVAVAAAIDVLCEPAVAITPVPGRLRVVVEAPVAEIRPAGTDVRAIGIGSRRSS